MGSLFKTSTPTVPVQTYNTYRDEVNQVEQVPVVNADGTVTYVTRKLPLTAEEQARQDELQTIRQGALDQIKTLSDSGYQLDDASQASLAAWEKQQQRDLETQYAQRTRAEEADLARRGLSDSSAGQSIRRQRRLDEQQSQEDLGSKSDELASQIRNQQLSLQQNLYSLAQQDLSSADAQQYQAAIQSQSRAAAADAQRQASLLDYYTRVNTQQSPVSAVLRTTMGSVTANPFGSNGLLGSWKL